MTRLLVCGDRHYRNGERIKAILSVYNSDTVVIHGGAPGADTLAGKAAVELGMQVVVFAADWKQYGKAAGPRRNQRMIDEGRPDEVLAFHDHIEQSKGTKDMLERAEAAGIRSFLFTESA